MKWVKTALVVIGALVITALGIDAADTLTGSGGTLLSQVIDSKQGACPEGMVQVEGGSVRCVDVYEVSPGKKCPVSDPSNTIQSLENLENTACEPESKPDVLPWRFITRDQAMQACARVGKRLPTSAEWYQLSLTMSAVESACNVRSGELKSTGGSPQCKTQTEVYDMVGNVWEWVVDDVIEGVYNNRQLPETGYVAQVDGGGMATVVATTTDQELFGHDYFWARSSGAYGIIRGGFYESGSDGGIYAVHADTLPTTAGTAIGFRCVK